MNSDERSKRKMQIRRKMKELSEDENMISGIHNYCDRWCERCSFTSRCRVYQMEADYEAVKKDDFNKQFWEELALNFEVCFDMIKEQFPDIETLSDEESERLLVYQEIDAEKMARDYAVGIRKWMLANSDFLDKKAEMFSNMKEDTLFSMLDAMSVLKWYEFFISAKIHRASLSLRDDLNELSDFCDDKEETNVRNNQNGSAKIALIAIEKSIQAMVYLYGCLPEKEDDILQFLSQLSQIKKGVLSRFPNAMDFKRPGFDD